MRQVPPAAPGPEPHEDSPIVQAVAPGYRFEGTALELGGLMIDATTLTSTHIRIPMGMLNRHGLVAGATDAAALGRLRQLCPSQWFLVPGIGAQGGDLAAVLAAGLLADGGGLLINASRSIWQAADAGAAARELMNEINEHRTVAAV